MLKSFATSLNWHACVDGRLVVTVEETETIQKNVRGITIISKKGLTSCEKMETVDNGELEEDVNFWRRCAQGILAIAPALRIEDMFIAIRITMDSNQCAFTTTFDQDLPMIEIFWDIYVLEGGQMEDDEGRD
jgi:hypothetical protein